MVKYVGLRKKVATPVMRLPLALVHSNCGSRSAPTGRKVQTGVKPGTECKLRLEIAGFLVFYPHAVPRTGSELTELESNRDEWE